jgi:hypothetical protein
LIPPSRSRHGPAGRALAVWLMAAQVILLSATGLTHSHAIQPGDGDPASAASHVLHASPARATLHTSSDRHRSRAADCAICQAVRSTVASIATAHRTLASSTLCGQTSVDLPVFLPDPPTGPCSTRAPPSA